MTAALFSFEDLVHRVCPEFTGQWKVLRHKDNHPDMPDLFELSFTERGRRVIDIYQSWQGVNMLGKCDGAFSFVGLPNRRALFIGAYTVGDTEQRPLPPVAEAPEELKAMWQVWAQQRWPGAGPLPLRTHP